MGRWGLPAVALLLAAAAILGGAGSVQRFAGVFVGIVVWATPFVLLAAVAAGAAWNPAAATAAVWPGVLAEAVFRPARVPWAVSDSLRGARDTRSVLLGLLLTFVIAPTVVLGGLVEPGQYARWAVSLGVSLAAVLVGTAVSVWPPRFRLLGGRHEAPGVADNDPEWEVPVPMAGITPRPRRDFVSRCADIASVSLRLTVLGAAVVAAVVGLPPDGWIVWLQERPVAGILLGVLVGVLFPPVPEAVAPAFVAFAPLGAGAQIAFAVPALVGNIGLQRRIADFLPARTPFRDGIVVMAFAVTAAAWGAVVA